MSCNQVHPGRFWLVKAQLIISIFGVKIYVMKISFIAQGKDTAQLEWVSYVYTRMWHWILQLWNVVALNVLLFLIFVLFWIIYPDMSPVLINSFTSNLEHWVILSEIQFPPLPPFPVLISLSKFLIKDSRYLNIVCINNNKLLEELYSNPTDWGWGNL